MEIALIVVGSLMIAATLLPFSRSEAWWVRLFDFPRVQIAALSAAVLAAYLLLGYGGSTLETVFLVALAACLLYQLYATYPYTPLCPKQVQTSAQPEGGAGIRLLFGNVFMENREAGRLKRIIREHDPDVVLLVETDDWWAGQLSELKETHPHAVLRPQDNTYGMVLFSRLELLGPEVKFLIQDDVPSIHALVRLPSGPPVELHCLHPRPPFPTEDERSTERDAELIVVGKAVKDSDAPVIVMGDLNDVAWSRTNYLFQKISGLLDPRIGRGFYNTFHARYPLVRFPLDHFFHSKQFRLLDFKVLPYFGSDHFPVYISLSYEPDAERQHAEPRADADERREADEKVARAS